MAEQSQSADATDERSAAWIELLRDGRAVYSVLLNLGIGLHALDIFVITTVMPAVVADIGGIAFYTWTSMLYMVGSIVGAAAGSHMRARLGRQRGYFWAGIVLLVGTVACAVPPDMASLLAARTLKGFGGGLVISQSMALISDLYEPRIRGRILATITTTWSIAALIGPAIGGAFAEIGWWRGAFWATAPFAIAFSWMAIRHVPTDDAAAPDRRIPWRRLALLAAGVMVVGITSQLENAFLNGVLIALAAVLVWLTFRIDEAAEHSLFPVRALSVFTPVGLAYWTYFSISVTHSALLIFAPLFLQVLHDMSPLYIGYLSLVFSIGWTLGSIGVSGWSDRWARIALVSGMVITGAFSIAFIFAVIHGPLMLVTIYILIIGVGIGATNVIATTYGMAVAREGEESVTASAMPTMRSIGVAFGAAIAGLVANSAGLDQGTARETVAHVALWVLGFTAIVPFIGAGFTLAAALWGWQFRRGR